MSQDGTEMPDSYARQQIATTSLENGQTLKYLDFVQVAAIYILVCFSGLYEFAKDNAGPLKPGVETVEGTVKTVVGPVYQKFQDVPFELLKFVDRKVDDSLRELERYLPSLVKQASSQARAVASEVQRTGLVDTAMNITSSAYHKYEPTAKELYSRYEPVVEQYAVSAWRSLNGLPLFPQVAQIIVPTAVYWSEKYNQVVSYSSERGYTVAAYMPLIPIERISKVFENDHSVSTSGETVVAN